eukprot:1004076-Rhodomonas_salina.2
MLSRPSTAWTLLAFVLMRSDSAQLPSTLVTGKHRECSGMLSSDPRSSLFLTRSTGSGEHRFSTRRSR